MDKPTTENTSTASRVSVPTIVCSKRSRAASVQNKKCHPLTDVLVAEIGAGQRHAKSHADICGLVEWLKTVAAGALTAWPLQVSTWGHGADSVASATIFMEPKRWVEASNKGSTPSQAALAFILVLQSSPVQPAGQRHQPVIASQTPTKLQPHGQVRLPRGGSLAGIGSWARYRPHQSPRVLWQRSLVTAGSALAIGRW